MSFSYSIVLSNKLIDSRLRSLVQQTSPHLLRNSSTLFHKSIVISLKICAEVQSGQRFQSALCLSVPYQSEGSDTVEVEDDDTCPIDCVKEFKTDAEFFEILDKAKKRNLLVVVDFYRTACGSCKYIEQGFTKLCKGSGDHEDPIIFLKHNVIDEYDEQSEVAERLSIKDMFPSSIIYKSTTSAYININRVLTYAIDMYSLATEEGDSTTIPLLQGWYPSGGISNQRQGEDTGSYQEIYIGSSIGDCHIPTGHWDQHF